MYFTLGQSVLPQTFSQLESLGCTVTTFVCCVALVSLISRLKPSVNHIWYLMSHLFANDSTHVRRKEIATYMLLVFHGLTRLYTCPTHANTFLATTIVCSKGIPPCQMISINFGEYFGMFRGVVLMPHSGEIGDGSIS